MLGKVFWVLETNIAALEIKDIKITGIKIISPIITKTLYKVLYVFDFSADLLTMVVYHKKIKKQTKIKNILYIKTIKFFQN